VTSLKLCIAGRLGKRQSDNKGNRMTDRQSCAEKLHLLGEMVDTAKQYLTQCDDAIERDDQVMTDLAAAELEPVEVRSMQLVKELAKFRKRLRTHIARNR
jgi:hypothetical protein